MSKRDKPNKAKKPTKTYLLRIYPTRKQTRTLERWLGWCCEVYNAGATSTYLLTLSEATNKEVCW